MATKEQLNMEHVRHSLAHILAMAVLHKMPKAKLGVGPAIEHGFYYDFELPEPLSDNDLKEIETIMKGLIKEGVGFKKEKWPLKKANEHFKDQPYKLELIKEKSDGKEAQVYISNDFIDFCKGGHVDSTKEIDPDSFMISHQAGAYWKGDEKNPMLTRIYGYAFQTKKELEEFKEQLELAKSRDHRKIGRALDLFVFSDLVGSGLPLWTPKGTLLRNLLDDFVWELRKAKGYERVDIPHITKKDLFETSGHWDKFKNELFRITTREGHEFAMKPMNCPFHTQIYASQLRSYRELPIRYADTTKCYRDEQTGELHGITRIRAFTQDDAHVFCRTEHIKVEMLSIWDIVETFYGAFGFEMEVRMSFSDPDNMDAYLGEKDSWAEAEKIIKKVVKERNVYAKEAKGEAAFYGPKIDFLAKDSLNREWQVATIQLDFNMPERFNLTCINEEGKAERVVMLHAAIMGSIERFLSILIEHTQGNFPTWLAPEQVRLVPISDKHVEYMETLAKELKKNDIRYTLDASNESMGKKIREAQLQKIPYILVAGDKEIKGDTVSIRHESKDLGARVTKEFIKKLIKEIKDRV